MIDRRTVVAGIGALSLLALAPSYGWAQTAAPEGLLIPGPLGDKIMGADTAKVTVIEYASMTCPHCGEFYRTTFKDFRAKYIDTGKVRFIFREFPLDAAAAGAAMLARCAPADRYFDVIDAYFGRQDAWVKTGDIYNAMFDIAKQFGFTQQSFEACLSNQALFEQLDAVKKRGATLGVDGTPTFFINGQKHVGEMTIADLGKIIDPLL